MALACPAGLETMPRVSARGPSQLPPGRGAGVRGRQGQVQARPHPQNLPRADPVRPGLQVRRVRPQADRRRQRGFDRQIVRLHRIVVLLLVPLELDRRRAGQNRQKLGLYSDAGEFNITTFFYTTIH